MKKEKRLLSFPTIKAYLEQMAGSNAPQLVEIWEKTSAQIKDEEMAEKMNLKVTDIRTILNRLHYRGVANYQKKKNKKTGWYSYTWTIDRNRILELVIEKQTEEIEKLEKRKMNESIYSYFSCKKNCHEFPFEIAAEYQFRCPECGLELNHLDNKKRNKKWGTKIEEMQKEVFEFKKLLK